MVQKELEQFKQIIESDFITEKINQKELTISQWLHRIIFFLIYCKDFKKIKSLLDKKSFTKDYYSFLVSYFKQHIKENVTVNEVLYEKFKTNGYFFHITKTNNVASILNEGIITLNKKTNQNLYIKCNEINACWEKIRARNKINNHSKLISIPLHHELYETRFNSSYLTLFLENTLDEYGYASELFYHFFDTLLMHVDQYITPEEFIKQCQNPKKELIRLLKNKLEISDNEINFLFTFFDICYEGNIITNRKNIGKSIIMIPQEKISPEYINGENYFHLLQQKDSFYRNLKVCNDIEYHKSIDNQDLIAISIEEDQDKVKLKVRKSIENKQKKK